MDIANVLTFGWPGAEWTLNGDEYEGLVWAETNEQEKPTLEEIEAVYPAYVEHRDTPPLADQLKSFFESNLTDELQADLAPLKAAIKLELDQNRPHIARLIVQRATIPEELESLRQQMLQAFPNVS